MMKRNTSRSSRALKTALFLTAFSQANPSQAEETDLSKDDVLQACLQVRRDLDKQSRQFRIAIAILLNPDEFNSYTVAESHFYYGIDVNDCEERLPENCPFTVEDVAKSLGVDESDFACVNGGKDLSDHVGGVTVLYPKPRLTKEGYITNDDEDKLPLLNLCHGTSLSYNSDDIADSDNKMKVCNDKFSSDDIGFLACVIPASYGLQYALESFDDCSCGISEEAHKKHEKLEKKRKAKYLKIESDIDLCIANAEGLADDSEVLKGIRERISSISPNLMLEVRKIVWDSGYNKDKVAQYLKELRQSKSPESQRELEGKRNAEQSSLKAKQAKINNIIEKRK